MIRPLVQIWNRRDLLWYQIVRNLKVRYKNSTLGFLWSLLNPLLMMLIYFLFTRLLRFSVDLPFLLTGVIAWHFTNLCLGDALGSITGHTHLVKKIAFPRMILPLSMVLANSINSLLSFAVLSAFLVLFQVQFTSHVLLIPLVFAVQVLFCLGFSLILCTLSVYFDDTRHILGAVMSAWFFLSPVIYPPSMVPERYTPFFVCNPMTGILSAYRLGFLNAAWPGWEWPALGISAAWALGLCLAGVCFFEKYEKFFADEL